MDMGIRGRKAIVCAASKGLGKGCAMALAGEGVDLVINARTRSELEATAEEIRALGVGVIFVESITDPRLATRIAAETASCCACVNSAPIRSASCITKRRAPHGKNSSHPAAMSRSAPRATNRS